MVPAEGTWEPSDISSIISQTLSHASLCSPLMLTDTHTVVQTYPVISSVHSHLSETASLFIQRVGESSTFAVLVFFVSLLSSVSNLSVCFPFYVGGYVRVCVRVKLSDGIIFFVMATLSLSQSSCFQVRDVPQSCSPTAVCCIVRYHPLDILKPLSPL